MDIVHSAAFVAADVIMILGGSVKASLSTCQVHFEDHPLRTEDFKITVHSGNADLWKSFANQVMEVLSRGVGGYLFEFFQYHSALFSHSAWRIGIHAVLPGSLSLLRCNSNKLPDASTRVKIFFEMRKLLCISGKLLRMRHGHVLRLASRPVTHARIRSETETFFVDKPMPKL
jgi:hypothetical protein